MTAVVLTLKNFQYWVDPNTGNPQDAILVYCDMAKQATCVQPKPTSSAEMAIETPEREIWFSDVQDGGFQFTYKADSNQISFLQMLSSSASQDITYHCFNSLAYYSAKKDHYRKALGLMSWNDLEIRGRGRFSYEVPVDECQARSFFSSMKSLHIGVATLHAWRSWLFPTCCSGFKSFLDKSKRC